ncbi:tetratricopeptide repeat protein [Rudaea sp.]|uniref:tetratricopeptide repeat protein n=1 Tax=Rudaea sp. TaxID=2136325 RepID=UPI002ED1702C
MQRASALLQSGNFAAARALLEQTVRAAPTFVEAQRLLAGAMLGLGERAGAERVLRQAAAIDPEWAPVQCALGELLIDSGRADEGEHALRRAATCANRYLRADRLLARLLNASDRYGEVVDLTEASAQDTHADPDLLHQRAVALVALQRHEEAIATCRRIVELAPDNAKAEFFLASALDLAGRHSEAGQSASRAIAKGEATPEARHLLAHALVDENRLEEAEALLHDIVRERPRFADAHNNLAQLIWVRRGDVAAAAEYLDRALAQYPRDNALISVKMNLLDGAGDAQGALAFFETCLDAGNSDPGLLMAASRAALKADAPRALAYARRAQQLAPGPSSERVMINALLGAGDAVEALQRTESLLRTAPDDQHLIAMQTTAWRLLGDPRYAGYCDYAGMARGWTIDTPTGWNDLRAYLADLAVSLKRLHTSRAHPLNQSLRHGSQTAQNLLDIDDPAIRAFFSAIDGPIHRHIETIGHGGDPLRRRNTGAYKIAGIWSVRLNARGYHTNHVHPQGWLSSACYIELPRAVAGDNPGREGFLKFGEPGYPTQPRLEPEYFIRPEPGLLALFPSYFWHGTVPFGGDDTRLTIAFDLVPV